MISPTRCSLRKLVLLALLSILRSVVAEETWVEVGAVVASDAAEGGGYFGGAVAISGMTMVVGDPDYDGQKGRAYVFSWNGTGFEQDAVLDPKETTSFFGDAVAVDGGTIVVGAFGSDAAFVFVKDGREWELQQRLTRSLEGGFGIAVAVDGDRVVVGAYTANGFIGAAHVFERSGTKTWSETTILTPSDGANNGQFGYTVDVEGDAIVGGAPGRNSSMGAVYVFNLNATSKVWAETKIMEASDGVSGDQFGYSVALSGTSFVVGAIRSNNLNGSAYVYTGLDFEETKLIQGDATGRDRFGSSVALFGDTAVVGAPFHDGSDGAGYIFVRSGKDDSWSQTTKLTSSENNGEKFGWAAAISGDFVAAGAASSSLAADSAGAVYVFEVEEDVKTRTCLFHILCK
jgi:hypothetical protein